MATYSWSPDYTISQSRKVILTAKVLRDWLFRIWVPKEILDITIWVPFSFWYTEFVCLLMESTWFYSHILFLLRVTLGCNAVLVGKASCIVLYTVYDHTNDCHSSLLHNIKFRIVMQVIHFGFGGLYDVILNIWMWLHRIYESIWLTTLSIYTTPSDLLASMCAVI